MWNWPLSCFFFKRTISIPTWWTGILFNIFISVRYNQRKLPSKRKNKKSFYGHLMKWKNRKWNPDSVLRIKQTLDDKDPVGHRISCRISQLSTRFRAKRTGKSWDGQRSFNYLKLGWNTISDFLLFLVAIFKSWKWCSSTVAKKFNSKTSRSRCGSNWFVDFEFEHLTINHTLNCSTIT